MAVTITPDDEAQLSEAVAVAAVAVPLGHRRFTLFFRLLGNQQIGRQ